MYSKRMLVSGKHLSVHVSADPFETIEAIQEEEGTDRSTAVERLLRRGVEDWRLEAAVRRYRDGDLSLGGATRFANVSIWRMLDVLDERNVEVNYSSADLADDLTAVENR